jgi:hypothetical protein
MTPTQELLNDLKSHPMGCSECGTTNQLLLIAVEQMIELEEKLNGIEKRIGTFSSAVAKDSKDAARYRALRCAWVSANRNVENSDFDDLTDHYMKIEEAKNV